MKCVATFAHVADSPTGVRAEFYLSQQRAVHTKNVVSQNSVKIFDDQLSGGRIDEVDSLGMALQLRDFRARRRRMPEKETLRRARADKRAGKSSSTQAGEFVCEEASTPRHEASPPSFVTVGR